MNAVLVVECITNIPVVPRNYVGEIKDIFISIGNVHRKCRQRRFFMYGVLAYGFQNV